MVAAADHLGRPADQVEAELAALGLRVQRVAVERSDVPAGQVVELGPVGALTRGDLVTLTVAVAPTPAPVVPAVPVPAPAPVAVGDAWDGAGGGPAAGPGNGNGAGRGNGWGTGRDQP